MQRYESRFLVGSASIEHVPGSLSGAAIAARPCGKRASLPYFKTGFTRR
jgi:hypothetical protein